MTRKTNGQGKGKRGGQASSGGERRKESSPEAIQALQHGLALHQAGHLAEAEGQYRKVLELEPDNADALHFLGVAALHAGRAGEAAELIGKAISLNGAHPDLHDNLGAALAAQGDFAAAVECHRRALELDSCYANAHYNLGNVFHRMGNLAAAEESYRRALDLLPNDVAARSDLGVTVLLQGRVDEAIDHYRQALRLNPGNPGAHHNLGRALLLKGDLAAGWVEYEWRWKCHDFPAKDRGFAQPRWDGSELEGRTILIHAEQGMGDTIQFIRYAPLVARRGGRVIVECQKPLQRLVRGVDGVSQVIAQGDGLADFDVHLPMMSLPFVFRTTLETIPAGGPYLKVPEGLEFALGEGAGQRLKVGIVWSGSPVYGYNRERSCSLTHFLGLAGIDGVALYSLQKGPAKEDLQHSDGAGEVIDLSPRLGDFADTAAAVRELDLVVSVDTAVPRLAGALGRPVWLALSSPPEWRWLLNREDCPWYPSMRLFRQDSPGDWDSVFQRIGAALAEMARHKAG